MPNLPRETELTDLYDLCISRKNIHLYGATGIGKSYILQKLIQKLKGRRVCFYFSLRGLISVSVFSAQLLEELKRRGREHDNLQYQLRRFFNDKPSDNIKSMGELTLWLDSLFVVLSQISMDFLFILEDLHEWEMGEELEEVKLLFRGIDNVQNCHLLLSSNRSFYENKQKGGFTPFRLKAIPEERIWNKAPQPWQSRAYDFSRGNTGFLIEILKTYDEEEGDLNKAIESIMNRYHPVLNKVRHRFTSLQWRLFRAIAFEEYVEQPHAFDFLVKYHLGAASSVERALKNLWDTHMIIKTKKGWRVSNIIYMRWVQWLYTR